MIEVIEKIGSAYWASYLINGDSSGLEERDIELADKWQAEAEPGYVVSVVDEEAWFSWSYGLYTGDSECAGGDCIGYILHVQRAST